MVPKDRRVGAGPSGNGRRSFLQQRCHSSSAVAALAHSSWPASCLEKNFTGESEAKFPMACVGRVGCRPGDDDLRGPALQRHVLFLSSDGTHPPPFHFPPSNLSIHSRRPP